MQPDVAQNMLSAVTRRIFPLAAAENGTPDLRVDDFFLEFFRSRYRRELKRHTYTVAGAGLEEPDPIFTKNWGFSRKPGRSSRTLLSMSISPDAKIRIAQRYRGFGAGPAITSPAGV